MKTLQVITITVLTVALGAIGYELTMTITTFGGYLPLAAITAAPALGFIVGRAV